MTHNSGGVLPDFLESVTGQVGVDIALYVVDNASTDSTLIQLERERRIERLHLISNDQNLGAAVGNNQGILAAIADACEWILLINNDTVFGEETLTALVAVANTDGLDLVSPIIEAAEPPGTIWYSGGRLDNKRAFLAQHVDAGESIDRGPSELRSVDYAPTTALLIRPAVFTAVGLIDPLYFAYFEDVDFCVRATRAGFRYWVTPAARVVHKASSLTGGIQSPFTIKWFWLNWPLFVRRNYAGVKRIYALAYIQALSVYLLMLRRDSLTTFLIHQRGFWSAMRISLAATPPQIG